MTPDRKKPTAGLWITVALAAVLVRYRLSFGPACWWFSGEPHEPVADEFVCDRWPIAPQIYWPIG